MRVWLAEIAVALVILVWLLAVGSQLPFVSDEGFYLERQEMLARWLDALTHPGWEGRVRLFGVDALDRYWCYSRELPDPHGPAASLVSLVGYWTAGQLLNAPTCHRVGPILLFALAASCTFATLRRHWSTLAALTAVSLLAFGPRLVPHFCYALTDGPLLSFVLLSCCAYTRACERESVTGRLTFGLCLGLALATKITSFLLLPAFALDACRQRRLPAFKTLLVGGGVAVFTLLFVNVGWWPNPISGVCRYLTAHLTRSASFCVPTLFLGTRYEYSLPWYNTLVWMLVATPITSLLLGLLGIAAVARCWRTDQGPAFVLLMVWAGFMVARALPGAPGHDGIRLILPGLGILAVLAGRGVEAIRRRAVQRWGQGWGTVLAGLVALAATGESLVSTTRYHPHQLSYYSPAIGGLPGAARLGFEPTYYYAALTPGVLNWLNANTSSSEWVLFGFARSIDYLARWDTLRVRHRRAPGLPALPRWVVIEHRPGLYEPYHAWLFAHGQPAYQEVLFGVPLISIYPRDQVGEAVNRTLNPGQAAGPPLGPLGTTNCERRTEDILTCTP